MKNPVMIIVMTFPKPVCDGPQQLSDFACNPPLIWIGSAERDEQIVMAWAAGDHALELLVLPEQSQFERALTSVRAVTGNSRAMYASASVRVWTEADLIDGVLSCVDGHATSSGENGAVEQGVRGPADPDGPIRITGYRDVSGPA